jgi:AcrR family transcriptional regulator
MARQGYEQTSIRDVARETDFSLAGIYYYVTGKEDLLCKIQARTFESLLEAQEQLVAQAGRPEEKLRRLVGCHLSYMADHESELKVCTFEFESLRGDHHRRITELRKRYYKLVAGIIADLIGTTDPEGGDALETRHMTLFVFGVLNWSLMWFDRSKDGPIDRLADRVVGFVLHGLPRHSG